MRYVIIGGGIAGTTAAETIRKIDNKAEITLISEEQHPVYSRVLLTPYLVGKVARERVFLKKESWYSEKNIEWLRGERVQKLDTKNKFVEITSGREIEYDKLLIASGVEARHASWDLRGVVNFRNLPDTDHIHQLIQEQEEGASVCLYGGGFISCDFLEIFHKHNFKMTIVFRGECFWSRVLEPELGKFINDHLEKNGVRVMNNTTIESVSGDKELEKIQTTNGEIEAKILAVGIGVEKDFSWIKEAGVEVDKGVVCDEYLRTSDENVFVAGDIAEYYDVVVERRHLTGTWLNAIQQGRIAAQNMVGENKEFDLVSSYAANALGLEIIFIGDTSKSDAESVRVEGGDEGKVQLFERNGRIVGAILVNMNTQRAKITKMIKEKSLATEFFV